MHYEYITRHTTIRIWLALDFTVQYHFCYDFEITFTPDLYELLLAMLNTILVYNKLGLFLNLRHPSLNFNILKSPDVGFFSGVRPHR